MKLILNKKSIYNNSQYDNPQFILLHRYDNTSGILSHYQTYIENAYAFDVLLGIRVSFDPVITKLFSFTDYFTINTNLPNQYDNIDFSSFILHENATSLIINPYKSTTNLYKSTNISSNNIYPISLAKWCSMNIQINPKILQLADYFIHTNNITSNNTLGILYRSSDYTFIPTDHDISLSIPLIIDNITKILTKFNYINNIFIVSDTDVLTNILKSAFKTINVLQLQNLLFEESPSRYNNDYIEHTFDDTQIKTLNFQYIASCIIFSKLLITYTNCNTNAAFFIASRRELTEYDYYKYV